MLKLFVFIGKVGSQREEDTEKEATPTDYLPKRPQWWELSWSEAMN